MTRNRIAAHVFSAILAKYTTLDPPADKIAAQAVAYTDALLNELERTARPSYRWGETLEEAEKRMSSTNTNYEDDESLTGV